MKSTNTEVLGFRLTQEEKRDLETLAFKENRTVANLIQSIIRKSLREVK